MVEFFVLPGFTIFLMIFLTNFLTFFLTIFWRILYDEFFTNSLTNLFDEFFWTIIFSSLQALGLEFLLRSCLTNPFLAALWQVLTVIWDFREVLEKVLLQITVLCFLVWILLVTKCILYKYKGILHFFFKLQYLTCISMSSILHSTVASGGAGGQPPSLFGRSINPISTSGAHSPHPVLQVPPDFQPLRRPCYMILFFNDPSLG